MMGTNPCTFDGLVGALLFAPNATSSIASIMSLTMIHLTRENLLPWKTQAFPALHVAHLYGYIDGFIFQHALTLTKGYGTAAIKVANPAFSRWHQ